MSRPACKPLRAGRYRVLIGTAHQPVRSYIRTDAHWWVDCTTCGAVAPRVEPVYWHGTDGSLHPCPGEGTVEVGEADGTVVATCERCGAAGRVRRVTERRGRGGTRSQCGGACLAGQVSCDCRCRGRCHGAGICRCDTAKAA